MNRLRLLREEKGLFQADIGKFIGVSSQAVGNYENEKRDMSPEIIIKLANFFGVTTDYLLGKSDERTISNSANTINTDGLSEEEIAELRKQAEFMKWKKNN